MTQIKRLHRIARLAGFHAETTFVCALNVSRGKSYVILSSV